MLLIITLSTVFAILTADAAKLKPNLKLNKMEIIYLIATALMGIGTDFISKVLLTTDSVQILPILLAISISIGGGDSDHVACAAKESYTAGDECCSYGYYNLLYFIRGCNAGNTDKCCSIYAGFDECYN